MDWNPSARATHVEAVLDPLDAGPGSLLIEHFNDPYEAVLDDDGDAALHAAAHGYLRALAAHERIGSHLPDYVRSQWVPALDPAAPAESVSPFFGWLPFEDRASGHTIFGPRGSIRFRSASDHLAVLYASDRISPRHYTGSGFALALAVHIRESAGKLVASFTGMMAGLPYGHFRAHPISAPALSSFGDVFRKRSLYRDDAVDGMARMANMARVVVRSIRIAASGQEWWIERRGVGVRTAGAGPDGTGGVEMPYAVTMLSTGGKAAPQGTHTITHVSPMVAHAAEDARVFDADPASFAGRLVRPTRDEKADPPRRPVGLDTFRRAARISSAGNAKVALQYPTDAPLVKVMPCPRFVRSDRGPGENQPREVNLASLNGPQVRSDDASAVQAFFHTRDLVQRLEAYGWTDPAAYFRLTAPEIKIFYRSGISPGPGKDGCTVNARVFPEGWRREQMGMPPNAQRPAIQIHLAWADLRRRERQAWTWGGPPAPAIPFGLPADRRWMWHEFGHVLLVASTGELEFRFAHSPGDALAAIVADPDSKLPPNLRGATFPFVFLPRRHDRCAHHGWSWSGTLHQALAGVPDASHPRRKGYASEQILSSSLFRLYRCIGGDTRGSGVASADDHERRRASHYMLYLVMQAMQLMGDARIQATSTPAKFVHWLRQADLQPGEWKAVYGGETFSRMGGTLGKVIRWAFEAQGLYGSGNGPGLPEPVDIYIEDGRPTKDDALYGPAEYGRGSYVPVSLHWQSRDDTANANAPRWQADPASGIVFREADGMVEVHVGNRGSEVANGVDVLLWSSEWPAGTEPPPWRPGGAGWKQCPPAAAAAGARIIAGAGRESFTFQFAPGRGVHILFAQATCADDRANTDPAVSLACCFHDTPLADLVANDNNLALRVVAVRQD